MDQPWLTPEQAGIASGVAGAALIVLCALFGGVGRWLARSDRGRAVVTLGFVLLGALAGAAVAAGAWGYATRQPVWIWCPAAGLGLAMAGVLVCGLPGIVFRYRRARQRKALDDLARQLIAGTSSRILARAEPRPRPR